MKKVVALLIISLFATSAFAIVDDGVNSMGIYFDLTADTYESAFPLMTPTPVYVILTNPDFDALFGYEFSYMIEGNFYDMGQVIHGTGALNVMAAPNFIVGLASPMPAEEATVLATITVMAMSADPIYFTLKGASPNSVPGSNTPAVLLDNDMIRATGVLAWDEATEAPGICAVANGSGVVVATDEASWDQVKSLYR